MHEEFQLRFDQNSMEYRASLVRLTAIQTRNGFLPRLALHMDVRTVCGQDTLYDSEPEPRSPLVPRAGFICPVESIEKPLQMLLRDSDSCIFYGDDDQTVLPLSGEGDPALSCKLNGIGDQVFNHLFNFIRVRIDRQGFTAGF